MHLLIPFASTLAPDCRDALAGLVLPHLKRLLAQLAPEPAKAGDSGDAQSLSAPHERAIAQVLGLPVQDGKIAFAARSAADRPKVQAVDREASEAAMAPALQAEAAWGFVTPCHWQMGQDHVRMLDPAGLQLSVEHAQLLRQAMQPYFAEDGIALLDVCISNALGQPAALSWLAQGELFGELRSATLDRVSGRDLADWMPQGPGARVVRRLQSEMQMLLYTHAVNEERRQGGLLPVNSFWVSGCGGLPKKAPLDASGRTDSSAQGWDLTVEHSLRSAALADDADAYTKAWQKIDAGPVASLLEACSQQQTVHLSLCGERRCARWRSPAAGLQAKAAQWLRGLRGPSVQRILEEL